MKPRIILGPCRCKGCGAVVYLARFDRHIGVGWLPRQIVSAQWWVGVGEDIHVCRASAPAPSRSRDA